MIEKILGAGETLPTDWGVDGTSGYDFMNEVSAVQHDASSAAALGQLWHELTAAARGFRGRGSRRPGRKSCSVASMRSLRR